MDEAAPHDNFHACMILELLMGSGSPHCAEVTISGMSGTSQNTPETRSAARLGERRRHRHPNRPKVGALSGSATPPSSGASLPRPPGRGALGRRAGELQDLSTQSAAGNEARRGSCRSSRSSEAPRAACEPQPLRPAPGASSCPSSWAAIARMGTRWQGRLNGDISCVNQRGVNLY